MNANSGPFLYAASTIFRLRRPDRGSVDLAQVGGEDIQLGSVLGDGAPGDDDALLRKQLDDFFVGKRFAGCFLLNHIGDDVFDRRVGHADAVGGLDARGEEILHLEDAPRAFACICRKRPG